MESPFNSYNNLDIIDEDFDFEHPVYSHQRMNGEMPPLCVYIPTKKLMWELMNACVDIRDPKLLWFMKI